MLRKKGGNMITAGNHWDNIQNENVDENKRRKPCKTDNYDYRNGTSGWFLVHH
jgi:hypothetical protein